jgi:hypothetical protein
MKHKLYLVVALILLVLPSCSRQKAQEGEVYFPKVDKGAQWEYLVKLMTPKGQVIDGRLVVQVEGFETIAGNKYQKNVSTVTGVSGSKPQATYTRRTEKGIFRLEGNGQEYLATPFPVSVGSTWKTQSPEGEIQFMADKTEKMTVLNKEYENALKVSFHGEKKSSHIEGYTYFAPGVGEIMTNMKVGDMIIEYALEKYKL